jgi:predicted  nucleic acid-binding Zn-ribbon protein
LKRVVDKIYDSISRDRSKTSEINDQISDLTERLNDVSTEKQKENINQQITKSKEFLKKIETNITDNQRKLALSEKNYNDKKNYLDKQMKIEEERIQKLSTQI